MVAADDIESQRAFTEIPLRIKGYLRLARGLETGARADSAFGTTDLLIVLPVARIDKRYLAHYGADAQRFMARLLRQQPERKFARIFAGALLRKR